MNEMLAVETVAQQFNVSTRTVVRLIERRELRALRVGRQWRVRQEWIDEWVAKNTTEIKENAG